jgi:hypothetical protein
MRAWVSLCAGCLCVYRGLRVPFACPLCVVCLIVRCGRALRQVIDPADFGVERRIQFAHRLTGWNAMAYRAKQLGPSRVRPYPPSAPRAPWLTTGLPLRLHFYLSPHVLIALHPVSIGLSACYLGGTGWARSGLHISDDQIKAATTKIKNLADQRSITMDQVDAVLTRLAASPAAQSSSSFLTLVAGKAAGGDVQVQALA